MIKTLTSYLAVMSLARFRPSQKFERTVAEVEPAFSGLSRLKYRAVIIYEFMTLDPSS